MSKRIDFSQPLSADDAAYVADRPWLLRDAELAGIEVTFDDDFTVDGEDDEQDENTNPEGGSEETGDGSEDGSEGSEDDESEDDEDEAVDYSTWEYADLKDEAGNRELSKAGSKEQLIARLQEDDAARAAEEESDEDDSEDDESE